MKIFQSLLLLLLALVAVKAQENCDAICQERVDGVMRDLNAHRERGDRAEEQARNIQGNLDRTAKDMEDYKVELEKIRGYLQEDRETLARTRSDLEDYKGAVGRLEGEVQQKQNFAAELQGEVEKLTKELQTTKTQIAQVKEEASVEMEGFTSQIEMGERKLKKTEKELKDALELISELENVKVQINVKAIVQDASARWNHILSWWTGLVLPAKDDL